MVRSHFTAWPLYKLLLKACDAEICTGVFFKVWGQLEMKISFEDCKYSDGFVLLTDISQAPTTVLVLGNSQ